MFGMLEAAGGVLRGGTVVCGLLAAVADLEVEEEVMSDKKYVVPEEGLKAALDSAGQTVSGCPWQELATKAVEAFIRWQSENPMVPSDEDLEFLQRDAEGSVDLGFARRKWYITEWQRRMYLAPEPEVRPFV